MFRSYLPKIIFLIGVLCLFNSCQLWQNVKYSLGLHAKLEDSFYSLDEVNQIVKNALKYTGTPYRVGGSDQKGMDCSGLLFRIYQNSNFLIPRIANEQANYGLTIPINQAQKGDWIFFATGSNTIINHAGIVSSSKEGLNIQFIHASTSKGVREDNIMNKYWFNKVIKVIRPYKNNSK
ncbi:C40 family peptidase [Aquirufa sp. ROCK2-A2]